MPSPEAGGVAGVVVLYEMVSVRLVVARVLIPGGVAMAVSRRRPSAIPQQT
jgi:hypothetical protein